MTSFTPFGPCVNITQQEPHSSKHYTSKENINLSLLLGDLRYTLVSLDNCRNVL